MRQHQMEKLDATGPDAIFGDDDTNFDQQLEKFGVNTGKLKEPAVQHIFRAWVEDWEEDARKKNDCVSEALLLQKYKGLVFHDPDSGNEFCIWHQNIVRIPTRNLYAVTQHLLTRRNFIFLNSPRGFRRSLEERSHNFQLNFNLNFFVNPNHLKT